MNNNMNVGAVDFRVSEQPLLPSPIPQANGVRDTTAVKRVREK
jgi:hypothetical protein